MSLSSTIVASEVHKESQPCDASSESIEAAVPHRKEASQQTPVPCDPKPLTKIRSSNHLSPTHQLVRLSVHVKLERDHPKRGFDFAKAIFRIEVYLVFQRGRSGANLGSYFKG